MAMGRSTKTLLPVLALAAGVALLSLGARGCPPQPLEPGVDCWHTETGTQQRFKTLPPGTFGSLDGTEKTQSNPVTTQSIELTGNVDPADVEDLLAKCGCPEEVEYDITWLDPHGVETDPNSGHAVTQVKTPTTTVDTCIRRTARANVQNKGVASQVEIQLVAVRLKSVNPIEVTYGGGPPASRPKKYFDVFVTESGTQKVGKMTLTTNTIANGKANGDVLLGSLPVHYDVTFREVGNPTNEYYLKDLSLRLVNKVTGGKFVR
jgi:hypothetical protein